jgi:hypothetical protein
MILSRVPEGLLVVRQAHHGDQTGLFAAAWGNEDVAVVSPHVASAELAAKHHEDGWALWERRPTIDPETGQPFQFLALPPHEHVPLYRAGIDRVTQFDLWAGLLVSMHGVGIYNARYGTFSLTDHSYTAEEKTLIAEFMADMEDLQDGILKRSGHRAASHGPSDRAADDAEVRYLYFLLQVWDRLSLQFAFRLAADGVIAPMPNGPAHSDVDQMGRTGGLRCYSDGPFALRLDPYPFVEDGLLFPVEARVVADRRYRSPDDFLEAIADASPMTLDCRVRAA